MATRPRKRPSTRPPHTAVANSSQLVKDPTDDELRRQHRLENEYAQFLRVHQKLTGRKTTAEYARIRLVRRQDDETRRHHLHANGVKKAEHKGEGTKTALPVVDDQKPMARQGRPHTARDTSTTSALHHRDSRPIATRKRPQSAKQARRNATNDQDHVVAGHCVSVALLERYYYNPIPLTTHLATSRSAPRLQAALQYATVTQHGNGKHRRAAVSRDEEEKDLADRLVPPTHTVESHDTSGRLRIVVNMRHLEIREDEDDETEGTAAKDSAPSALGQRHERSDGDSAPLVPVPAMPAGRSAWGDAD